MGERERGSHHPTPLLHLKIFSGTPFRSTADEAEPSIQFIQSNNLAGKPMRCIIVKIA